MIGLENLSISRVERALVKSNEAVALIKALEARFIFAFKIRDFSAHDQLDFPDLIACNLQEFIAGNQRIIVVCIILAELRNERRGYFIAVNIF